MDRERQPLRNLIAALTVVLGCGPERWHAELSSNADAPVVVHRVTATTTTAANLGAGGATFTSSSPKNSVSFEVELTTRAGLVEGAVLGSRSACTVDGTVWATHYIGDAGLDYTRVGETLTAHTSQFMPNAFAAGPPSACEVELRVHSGRVGPGAPVFDPIDVARLCWTAEAGVVDGPCAEAALPRTIPARAVTVPGLRASWRSDAGRPLTVAAHVVVGDVTEEGDVVAAAACIGDGAPRQAHLSIIEGLADLVPGDSIAVVGNGFTAQDFRAPPDRCTVEVRYRTAPAPGSATIADTSSFCVAGTEVTAGACNGLAPGPAIVRITGEQATIERGDHREGPFDLGAAPSTAAWQAIVASIAATHDEGLVIAAAAQLEASRAVALADAAKAARLDVAIRVEAGGS